MDGFPVTITAPESAPARRLSLLYRLLHASVPVLFRLPDEVENDFRDSIRALANNFLRNSIYGLIVLYLLVVSPVMLLAQDGNTATWFWWAVFPIGMVLLGLWLFTRIWHQADYVEYVLGTAVWVCLSGTLYAALRLGDGFLGYVAGFESVYIIIIAFSVLRIRLLVAVVSCVASLLMALALAVMTQTVLDWVSVNLFFVAPVLVGLVNGYIQESTARRDFLLSAYQKSQTNLLRDVMLAGDHGCDEHACLESALQAVGESLGWKGVAVVSPGQEVPWELESSWSAPMSQPAEDAPDFWHLTAVQRLASAVHENRQAGALFLELSHLGAGYCLAMPVAIDAGERAVLLCWSESNQVEDAEFVAFMAQVSDHIGRFLDRIRQKARLEEMALHDSLTGLLNRPAFMERLSAAMSRYRRNPDTQLCVLFLDLDRFKWVNDHLGHQAGDRLLTTFSDRMKARFREHDAVARLGGDEFAVLLEGLELDDVLAMVRRIQATHDEAISIAGQQVQVIASIGIAFVSSRHEDADDVLGEADAAMYAAKNARTGSYCVFTEAIRRNLVPVPR